MTNLRTHPSRGGSFRCKLSLQSQLVTMPSYRVPIEDEVFRSMKVDNFSKTPYSDATQVGKPFTAYNPSL